IYHVVTGFDTDVMGELGLQAFVLAQNPTPISIMLVSFGMVLTSLYQPTKLNVVMTEIARGYSLGSHTSVKLISKKWDQFWNVPISEIRAQLQMNFLPELAVK
ncbi:MAG: Coq4 family protein, partial [Dolichospermum sp.]|nr:Coq4 family protein [Dolichospermum sp.]